MTRNVILNNVDHADLRIRTDRSPQLGDGVMYTMTFPFEFRNVQAWYPILFQKDARGSFFPVALFGFEDNENLYLNESGWDAPYIPAMIRREPFVIGVQHKGDDGKQARLLSLDMDSPRVSHDQGERLFQPLGGRTPFLEEMAVLLETIHDQLEHTRAFVEALEHHELIEALTIGITMADGSRNQLIGFHGIVEDKVQALPGAVLEEFSERGFLMPLFMSIASMSSIQRLAALKNERTGGGGESVARA